MSFRIAMWSGPRNISTAMMRAWGNRADTFVCDEPFYAFFLKQTGRDDPGRNEIIKNGETTWTSVVAQLTGPIPGGKAVYYQKHMTHHLLPEIDRDWMRRVTNCFLIRDPAEVIASYVKKKADPTLEDIGFVQQEEIFDWVRQETNTIPPVIDACDILENPAATLTSLCRSIGVPFTDTMLCWPPGLRQTDGIWAKYWYPEVATSTGFREPAPRQAVVIPERLKPIHDRALECYERLYRHRLI